ncbi:hypothetical protein [Nostoc sp. UIC 10630]|uniref:hypothetical protein n=1 Tax=Nostoc sp. UIC 10630 TaxID=2100146 RepID=UPI0013D84D9C|nr:hypothetical protein [Nostoc sp. UIC 10630]NEU81510.1 hypothetical protein [Nostoc sp. UIC 10630]
MAIYRTYSQASFYAPIQCFEVDEWADSNSRCYEIDCSLITPTKEAAPVPDWMLFEIYYWQIRYEKYLIVVDKYTALNYNNIDEYLNDFPEDNFLNQAGEYDTCMRVITLISNTADEDRDALVLWYRDHPEITTY